MIAFFQVVAGLVPLAQDVFSQVMDNGAIVTWLVQGVIALTAFSVKSEVSRLREEIGHARELLETKIAAVEKRMEERTE